MPFIHIRKRHKLLFYRILSALIAIAFSLTSVLPPAFAQVGTGFKPVPTILNLPAPGTMVPPSAAFVPVLLRGMTIHPNPLQFDFIIDTGNSGLDVVGVQNFEPLQKESEKLVKYFLASMTIPKDDLWVNLSPYEKDRIIPDELGKTELGRDMLAQDYILKQLTASLMYPEKELGKEFWDKVYKLANEKYGTTEIPVNTFNKVWILPETATVYEHGQTVYIVDAKLKVMLDSDYLAMHQSTGDRGQGTETKLNPEPRTLNPATEIIREIILPEIEKEVNEGQNFAPLRQIYHSLILAKWYKETIKASVGAYGHTPLLLQVYIDQKKIAGVESGDETLKDQIYAQYMEAYKKGVFNYIKEDYDRLSSEVIPRKYFSGGIKGDVKIDRTASGDKIKESAVGENYQLALRVAPQKDGTFLLKKSGDEVSMPKRLLPKLQTYLSTLNWKKKLLDLHNSPEEAAKLIEKLLLERKIAPKEIVEVLTGFYELLGTIYDRDEAVKNIVRYISWTPALAQLLDAWFQEIDDGFWGYNFNMCLTRDIFLDLSVSPLKFSELFDHLSPKLRDVAEIVSDPAGTFWRRTGLPLFNKIQIQNGRGMETTRLNIFTEWFYMDKSFRYRLRFDVKKIDGSYRALEINPMTHKIMLHKGLEYEPDEVSDKQDMAFYVKGDSGYGALIQEMSDIAKIISEEQKDPLRKQQLAAVVHWLENDQKLVSTQYAEVPAWIREGYHEKPFGHKGAPVSSQEMNQETKIVGLSKERQRNLSALKEKIRSTHPEEAAGQLNEEIIKGKLDYKDVLWLLDDTHLGDLEAWRWTAAVMLKLRPREFVWKLLEHFSEGFYGPKIRTPMLIDVMTKIDSLQTAHLLANTKFLHWALRLEDKLFGMSLDSSRALIKALYQQKVMTSGELAGLLISLIRMSQEKVQNHSLYEIKGIAVRQFNILESILKEMDSQDAEIIMAAFRKAFGQDIDLTKIGYDDSSIGSSSPITPQEARAMIKGKLLPEQHHLIDDIHVQLAMAYEGDFEAVYHAGPPERIEIIRGGKPGQSSSPAGEKARRGTMEEGKVAAKDELGGIDMNIIDLNRQGAGVDIQFDPVELQEIIDAGIDGFAPVIINITPLPSILPLLGLEPANREELPELSSSG